MLKSQYVYIYIYIYIYTYIYICKELCSKYSEKVFVIKKVKNTVLWTYIISDLKGEDIVWTFYEKELDKANQKEFRVEKVKRAKDMIILLIGGLMIKKDTVSMSKYFPETKFLRGSVKAELELLSYALKTDLKSSSVAKRTNLANLKSELN